MISGKAESGTTKTRWQQPAGSSGGQSSVDAWEHAKPKGKWIEVSADYEVLDALVREKKRKLRGTRVARRVRKEKLTCIQCSIMCLQMKRRKKGKRDKLGDRLEAFLKRKEEEDEATCLMEEMRKNVEAAQHKSFEAELQCSSGARRYVRQRSGSPEDDDDKNLSNRYKAGKLKT